MCTKALFAGCLSLLAGLVFADLARAQSVLLVQDDSYLPYMGEESSAPIGIYADILEEAGKRLGSKVFDLETVPWSRAVELVRNGGAQGLVGTYYRPIARPWIRHYSEPLFTERVSVFCRKGVAKENWEYPNDFKGLTFGNNSSYLSPGRRFFELVAAGEITLVEAQTTAMNLQMLNLGRLDCYVQENLSAEAEIRRHKLTGIERVKTISAETAHIGYSELWVGSAADTFISELDRVLKAMHDDGVIERIVRGYVDSW